MCIFIIQGLTFYPCSIGASNQKKIKAYAKNTNVQSLEVNNKE